MSIKSRKAHDYGNLCDPDRLYTESEVAEILKKSKQSLRNDRHLERGLPFIKYGRSVRYLGYDINQITQMNRVVPRIDR